MPISSCRYYRGGYNGILDALKRRDLELLDAIEDIEKKLGEFEKRISKLEGDSVIPNGDKGSYFVYKADKPIYSGSVEFDVTGLSEAGSVKDVLFVLTRGMTIENYQDYRFDIRKYAGSLDLLKSILGKDVEGEVNSGYWSGGEKIFFLPSYTYHFLILWGATDVYAERLCKDDGEKDNIRLAYPGWMTGKFSPTYIMIGWNAKYGTPPGGIYSNVRLPEGYKYELVKYQPLSIMDMD